MATDTTKKEAKSTGEINKLRRADVSVHGRLDTSLNALCAAISRCEDWRALGATHLSVNTMGAGLPSPQAQTVSAPWLTTTHAAPRRAISRASPS